MRKVFFTAGILWALAGCTDERPTDAGAGNTDTATTNTMVGTGNGGNTYSGADTSNLQGGNATGQAADSANGQKLNNGTNSNGNNTGTQQRPGTQ